MNRPLDPPPTLLPPSAGISAGPPRELELIDYLAAVLAHWRLVVGLGLALGLAGALLSLLAARQYEASALIAVTPPRMDARVPDSDIPLALEPIIRSDAILARVLADVGLDRPPVKLSVRAFSNRVAITVVPRTSFMQMTVTMPDAELARRAADELARRAVARYRAIGDDEGGSLEAHITQLTQQAEQRFTAAERALREYRTTAQIELLRKDVEARLGQRGEFLEVLVKIDAERGRLARAERELQARPEVNTTTETIVRSPVLEEVARSQSTESTILGLSVQSQRINDARREIDVDVATSRSTLAALEHQRDRMIEVGQVNAPTLPQLTALYGREAELARHQLEYDVARRAFEDASAAAQNARVRTSMRLPFAQVAERPTLPTAPKSRAVVRNTAIGLVTGVALACLVAFGRLALTRIALLPGSGTVAGASPDRTHVEN